VIKGHTDICQFKLKLSDPCAKIRLLNKQTKETKWQMQLKLLTVLALCIHFVNLLGMVWELLLQKNTLQVKSWT
jgi:poly-beta-hydroxyalkanoate depolymerase